MAWVPISWHELLRRHAQLVKIIVKSHKPALTRQGGENVEAGSNGENILPVPRMCIRSSLLGLRGKSLEIDQDFSLFVHNVVAFISIWTQISNTLRRQQQFSTFNWDTTTEDVTLYQVQKTGEILTYKEGSWWETDKLYLSFCWSLAMDCWLKAVQHVKLDRTWCDLDAGHLRFLHEELQSWMSSSRPSIGIFGSWHLWLPTLDVHSEV